MSNYKLNRIYGIIEDCYPDHRVIGYLSTQDSTGKIFTWCPDGPDCIHRIPVLGDDGFYHDGKCSLFHAIPHGGPICPYGLNCPLLNGAALSDTGSRAEHFCPFKHIIALDISGKNRNSTGGEVLANRILGGVVCTKFHRPGKGGAPFDEHCQTCSSLHFGEIVNGEYRIASHPNKGHLRLWGRKQDNSYMDLTSYKLVSVSKNQKGMPTHCCDRTWYDCRYSEYEEGLIHYVLVNMIHTTKTGTVVSVVPKFRMFTQDGNTNNSNLIRNDLLINFKRTQDRRDHQGDPNAPYIGDSYGSNLILGGSISLFFSPGSNLYHEEKMEKFNLRKQNKK